MTFAERLGGRREETQDISTEVCAYSVLNLCKNRIDIKLLHESQMEKLCKHIWSCCFRDCNVAWLVQQFDPDWNISTTIGWIDVKFNILL